jgi:hypothetical protein
MSDIIMKHFGKNNDIIQRLFLKEIRTMEIFRMYTDFRSYVKFFSPKAYSYVRSEFSSCLPHPKTLGNWYSTTDAKPGFTSESMEMLKLEVQNSEKPVICSLVLDEMAVRKHVEWDGIVELGSVLDDPALGEATRALVFMVVSINESWKIPVGYFFIHSITSTQKAELVKLCLTVLFECRCKREFITVLH